MKAAVAMTLASLQLAASTPDPAVTPCHLIKKVAVGCPDGPYYAPTNAIDLFDSYGFDAAKITADYTKAILRRYSCGSLRDDGSYPDLRLEVMKQGRVATEDGWRQVVKLAVYRTNYAGIWWVAPEYLDAGCRPTAKPNTNG
jgi:hypothetical protein